MSELRAANPRFLGLPLVVLALTLLFGRTAHASTPIPYAPPVAACFCNFLNHGALNYMSIGRLDGDNWEIFIVEESFGADAPPVGSEVVYGQRSAIIGEGEQVLLFAYPDGYYLRAFGDDSINFLGNASWGSNGVLFGEFCSYSASVRSLAVLFSETLSFDSTNCYEEFYIAFPDAPPPAWAKAAEEQEGCSSFSPTTAAAFVLALVVVFRRWALSTKNVLA